MSQTPSFVTNGMENVRVVVLYGDLQGAHYETLVDFGCCGYGHRGCCLCAATGTGAACGNIRSAARRWAIRLRHGGAAQDSRIRRHERIVASVEPRLSSGWKHANYGTRRTPAYCAQRRAGSEARCGP